MDEHDDGISLIPEEKIAVGLTLHRRGNQDGSSEYLRCMDRSGRKPQMMLIPQERRTGYPWTDVPKFQ